jgi:hypothetical protein
MKFTKHATEKFGVLRTFGFTLSQDQVTGAITAPDKRENRGSQTISTKVLDSKFALRVVHEERKGHNSCDNLLSREEKGP